MKTNAELLKVLDSLQQQMLKFSHYVIKNAERETLKLQFKILRSQFKHYDNSVTLTPTAKKAVVAIKFTYDIIYHRSKLTQDLALSELRLQILEFSKNRESIELLLAKTEEMKQMTSAFSKSSPSLFASHSTSLQSSENECDSTLNRTDTLRFS